MTNAKKIEHREHRIRRKLVDMSAYKKRDIPQLKGRYLKNTKLWWDDFWNSDLASAIDIKSDGQVIYRLATLIDERERIYKQAKKDRLVIGSQGQAVINPLYSALLKVDAEIRQLEDRIGMSHKSMISLVISIGQAKKSLADLNAQLEEE